MPEDWCITHEKKKKESSKKATVNVREGRIYEISDLGDFGTSDYSFRPSFEKVSIIFPIPYDIAILCFRPRSLVLCLQK